MKEKPLDSFAELDPNRIDVYFILKKNMELEMRRR